VVESVCRYVGGVFQLWCLIVFDVWFGRWVGALMMNLVSLVLFVWPAMDVASTLPCLQGLGRSSCFVSRMRVGLKQVAAFFFLSFLLPRFLVASV